jgi:hypothetical protein
VRESERKKCGNCNEFIVEQLLSKKKKMWRRMKENKRKFYIFFFFASKNVYNMSSVVFSAAYSNTQ